MINPQKKPNGDSDHDIKATFESRLGKARFTIDGPMAEKFTTYGLKALKWLAIIAGAIGTAIMAWMK